MQLRTARLHLLRPRELSDADREDAHEALLRGLASDQVMLREFGLLLKTGLRHLQVVLLGLWGASQTWQAMLVTC